MKKDLEQELENAFNKVKAKFGHIPLKYASLSNEVPTAGIHMGNFEIKVNPDFVEKTGLNPEKALEAILDHEVGHYIFHPFSLKRVIIELSSIQNIPYGEDKRQFYDDVNNNLRIIASKGKNTNIDELYRSIKITSAVEKVILSLYQDMTDRDFGMYGELGEKEKKAFERLKAINFLNYDNKTDSIEFVKKSEKRNRFDLKRFCKILHPLFEQDFKDGKNPKPAFGNSPSREDYSGRQIKKALKDLVEDGQISPTDAKRMINENKDKMDDGGFPGGRYSDAPELFADRFVYESLALKYSVVLKQTPIISSEGLYPTRHEKFEIGDNMGDLDLFNSYGRVLPGLSNKWVREEVEYHGEKEAVPNLMVILDDSRSMSNPLASISNAVLSSFVIAREYLKNKAEVGVVRFSDRTTLQGFTDEKYKVLDELLRFKNGGDTVLNLNPVKQLAESGKAHDYVLITDGKISNRAKVMRFMNSEADKGARTYFVQIGESGDSFYEGKVKVIPVGASDDIGSIVLDDIHKK